MNEVLFTITCAKCSSEKQILKDEAVNEGGFDIRLYTERTAVYIRCDCENDVEYKTL